MRILSLLVLLLLPLPAFAASDADARALVGRLEQEAIAMAAPSLAVAEKERRFRALLRNSFAMPQIAQFVLTRHWRAATAAQRREFLSLFEDTLVGVWVPRFRDYGGQRLDVLQIQPEPDGFLVDTVVQRPRGDGTGVTWRLIDTARGLRVMDIIVDGVSMALTQRSDYASVLRTAGGMDGLLGRMRQQVATMPK